MLYGRRHDASVIIMHCKVGSVAADTLWQRYLQDILPRAVTTGSRNAAFSFIALLASRCTDINVLRPFFFISVLVLSRLVKELLLLPTPNQMTRLGEAVQGVAKTRGIKESLGILLVFSAWTELVVGRLHDLRMFS